MNRLILGPLLGAILARRGGGGLAGGLGGAMAGRALGGRGALIAMMLPYAMQWIQRNGGLGGVLKRFQDKGYGRQAQSWVATGDNQDIDPNAIEDIVGRNELSRLSQQLGVPEQEVKQGFAEIMPEVINELTPDGELKAESDRILDESLPGIEHEVEQARLVSSQH